MRVTLPCHDNDSTNDGIYNNDDGHFYSQYKNLQIIE